MVFGDWLFCPGQSDCLTLGCFGRFEITQAGACRRQRFHRHGRLIASLQVGFDQFQGSLAIAKLFIRTGCQQPGDALISSASLVGVRLPPDNLTVLTPSSPMQN